MSLNLWHSHSFTLLISFFLLFTLFLLLDVAHVLPMTSYYFMVSSFLRFSLFLSHFLCVCFSICLPICLAHSFSMSLSSPLSASLSLSLPLSQAANGGGAPFSDYSSSVPSTPSMGQREMRIETIAASNTPTPIRKQSKRRSNIFTVSMRQLMQSTTHSHY